MKRVAMSRFARSYLRVRATDLMIDSVRIWRPGEPELFDGKTSRYIADVIYEGPGRLFEVMEGGTIVVGDESLQVSVTYLALPWDIDKLPEVHDVVKILTNDDPKLVGSIFTIEGVRRGGGLRSSRVFQVQTVTSAEKETW